MTVHAVPSWMTRADLDVVAATFARLLWRRARERSDADAADALARIGALLCLERTRGHAWVGPEEWAGRDMPLEATGVGPDPLPLLPTAEQWERALDVASRIGDHETSTPLVSRDDGSVALRRDDACEARLARAFAQRMRDRSARIELDQRTRAVFAALFEDAAPTGQALAAATALGSSLCVITGGPGTGKTTTVVRILALLLARRPGLRIAVCAPTGKATTRLASSIERQRADLPVDASIRASLVPELATVHRLLGYRPREQRFARDAHRPLDADVVVVDEASMLDLGLMDALVRALRPQTRLILLGDRDQLASVDAGAVLADLVGSRRCTGDGRSEEFARWAAPLFARACPVDPRADDHSDAVVELRHNFRFRERPGIAGLADALRVGDANAALEILAHPAQLDVVRHDPPARSDALGPILDPLLDPLGGQRSIDVAQRLHAIEHGMRVLTALRRGPWGVEGLNALAERRLIARGWDLGEAWYEGRPLLVGENVPELGLSNGDLGVVVRDDDDHRVAAFPEAGDAPWRRLALARLPHCETAWSMTVHKSQGSEFERVVLVLPPGRHPLLSRELLYTGVTRAREHVTVVGSEDAVRAAVEQVQRRRSGLPARLRQELGTG